MKLIKSAKKVRKRVLEDDDYAAYVNGSIADRGMELSSLAFYPNTMDPDLE